MPRAGLRKSLVEPPRPLEGTSVDGQRTPHVRLLSLLEMSSPSKSLKRPRKVLHPIATDTDVDPDESFAATLVESACASPARRARLLNPRT